MRHFGHIFLAILLFPAVAFGQAANLTNDQVRELVARGVPVVDVRTPAEWKQTGVIKGSHLLTFFDERGRADTKVWMEAFSKIAAPDEPVIIVCRSGKRSGEVGRFLDQKVGYSHISHLARGIMKWIADGNPVVAPQ